MKIASWNVNGIRAVLNKGFFEWLYKENPDILCLQEIKISGNQLTEELINPKDYITIWNCSKRKGYSGTSSFLKEKPLNSKINFDNPIFNDEGRIIETELNDFILYNVYFPNGQMSDERLKYKLDFYRDFLDYSLKQKKDKKKEIIIVGDFNTAHTEIDLKNPKANENYSGFLKIEREWIDKYLQAGYIDIFRKNHPDEKDHYSWWTYRFNARLNNVGWRIDYFLISDGLVSKVKEASILKDVTGSDHCPISLVIH